ncbi:MAG TPA: DUF3108 domain-containing protein [Pyrinomonadaceae bacterium]|jgi:hypothetical protein
MAAGSAQQSAAGDAAAGAPGQSPYRVGEKLTYSVTFSTFAPAAHVELLIAGRGTYFNHEGVELRARVVTVEAVRAAIYSINNDYVAYVDPKTGLPFHTQLVKRSPDPPPTVTSGSLATDSEIIDASTKTEDSAPATFDLLSALYFLRTQPLAPGAIYPLSVQNNGAQYQAELRMMGRETVKTPAGSFNAVVGQIRVRGDATADKYRVRVYFTDDANHTPVVVSARLPAGELRAELASLDVIEPAQPVAVAAQPAPTQRPTLKPRDINTEPKPLINLPFQIGEQLSFNFYLGTATQPVGIANFQVRSRGVYFSHDGILLSATLYTTEAGQRLFPVSDKIDAYVDARTLLPFRTELRVQEGRHRSQGTVSVDQERGSATASDGRPIEIPVGTYDWVSVLYALRSFDLTPPKRNAVSILINKRPRTLFITALKRETIELGGQRIPAVQLALATDEAQGDRLALRLWVSIDRRRLPLRLTATTPIGPVRADLSIIPLTRQ